MITEPTIKKLDSDLERLAFDFNRSGVVDLKLCRTGRSKGRVKLSVSLQTRVFSSGPFLSRRLSEYFYPMRLKDGRFRVRPGENFLRAVEPYVEKLEDYGMLEYLRRALRVKGMQSGELRKKAMLEIRRRNETLFAHRRGRPTDWVTAIRHSQEVRKLLARQVYRIVEERREE